MIIMLAVVIAFIAIVGGFKVFQIKAAMSQSWQAPPEAVSTVVTTQEEWKTTLNAIGTVVAVNGVTIGADLPGVVESIEFDSGQTVNKGDVLMRLDTKQERAQLNAAEAQRELTRLDLERSKEMLAKQIIPQSTYDNTVAQFKSADARVGEIKATIERKTIRAPFAGILGIREVNLGQYLAGGAPIVSLQAMHPAYVVFNVPQQEIGKIRVGEPVEVTAESMPKSEVGKISAFDSVVDEATRNVRVQAIFDNASGKLHPGMFVHAQLVRGASTQAITLPASAISYAPYGDSVFIVEEKTDPKTQKPSRVVRQQFVKLGGSRGDQVAVVSGVKAGEEVVTSGVFKLRPGAAVVVNNSIQPTNNPKPRPEDS
jgi:membrane fusion protein (multidrug efflux system)